MSGIFKDKHYKVAKLNYARSQASRLERTHTELDGAIGIYKSIECSSELDGAGSSRVDVAVT